jgi:hypothetical protein
MTDRSPAGLGALGTLNMDSKVPLASRLMKSDKSTLFRDLEPDVTKALKKRLDLEIKSLPKGMTPNQIRTRLMSRFAGFNPALGSTNGSSGKASGPKPAKALKLNVLSVKADDLVDELLVDWGTDVIVMGGLAFSNANQRIQVSQFSVGEFSKSQKKKTFSGDGRDFAVFDLAGDDNWPRFYVAEFVLAERDVDGGFIDFLLKLWDAIDQVVIDSLVGIIIAALGIGVGAAVGGAEVGAGAGAAATAPTGPGIVAGAATGAAIGAAVGLVLGFAVALITEALKDDVFEPVSLIPWVLQAPTERFDGGTTSPQYDVEITRSDASYLVTYNWSLVV